MKWIAGCDAHRGRYQSIHNWQRHRVPNHDVDILLVDERAGIFEQIVREILAQALQLEKLGNREKCPSRREVAPGAAIRKAWDNSVLPQAAPVNRFIQIQNRAGLGEVALLGQGLQ